MKDLFILVSCCLAGVMANAQPPAAPKPISPLWWWMCREPWTWAGCLMTPALFWIALRNPAGEEEP